MAQVKYIVGNWKANKLLPEVEGWFEKFSLSYRRLGGVESVVAVPLIFVEPARLAIKKFKLDCVKLAVQDISPLPMGAYTGAVAAGQVEGLVEYGVVGHSERRKYFHETNQDVANKVGRLVEAGIRPIVCVDEPYMREQLAAIRVEELKQMTVAYEPVAAIGTGDPAEPGHVEEVVGKIKDLANGVRVLYGGSTNRDNCKKYLEIEGVDGLLVGGASLNADGFWEIVMRAASGGT